MKIQNVQRTTFRFQWRVHMTLVQMWNSGSLTGCDKDREKSLTNYGTGQTDSPSDLCVCRAVSLRYSHSPPCLPLLLYRVFPLRGSVIPEARPSWPRGSALASSSSILKPAGTGSIRHRGSFWHLLPLPKPCHSNPMHEQNNT